ncbi:hypothetical protein C7H75_24875 (plasmid) [Prescottella equi]|nr:hypothetical protein C7H75_24875 [Prescottella equi]
MFFMPGRPGLTGKDTVNDILGPDARAALNRLVRGTTPAPAADLADADTENDLRRRALLMVTRFTAIHRDTPGAKGVDTAARLQHFIEQARQHGATAADITAAQDRA